MEIVLGVFHTMTFDARITAGAMMYPFDLRVDSPSVWEEWGLMEIVDWACYEAEKIHFCLDRMYLPLSSCSISCNELEQIIKHDFIGKVQFWLKNHKVATSKVLELIRMSREQIFKFENIDLNSIDDAQPENL